MAIAPPATLNTMTIASAALNVSGTNAAVVRSKSVAIAAFGSALDAEHLEGQRGGAQATITLPASAIFASGTVTDNRAIDVVTGSNSIRDGAFANASGLPIVIQNTGANVLIQSATIVNVQLH